MTPDQNIKPGEVIAEGQVAQEEAEALESGPASAGLKLIAAVRGLWASSVRRAIDDGTDLTVQDEQGMTALHHAAARGARPIIRLLVNSGRCDYLIRDNLGRYASELAIEGARDYAVARLLLKKQVAQAAERGVPAYIPRP